MNVEVLSLSVILHAGLWVVGWLLFSRTPHLAEKRSAGAYTPISVIVPARDEQERIVPLLESLRNQTLVPAQIIVADDGSVDRTALMARSHGAHVVSCRPAPAGWKGKNWACQEGARAATGEVLLFVDADTRLKPDALERIASFLALHSGALSIQPYHEVRLPYEQMSAFFNVVQLMASGAFTVLGPRASFKRMFGPSLAIRRPDYETIGGHACVRGAVLENVVMSEHLARRGVPFFCVTGGGLLSFRMYPHGLKELINGWTKSFATGAAAIPPGVLVLVIAWFTGALGTFRHGLTAFFTGSAAAPIVGLCYSLYVIQIMWMLRQAGRFSFWMALIYPVGMMFFVGVFLWSGFLSLAGRKRVWKGRPV